MKTNNDLVKNDRLILGTKSEQLACNFLRSKNYKIIEQNINYRFGEIDIVAYDGNILCFVEVRSKTSTKFGTPEESVGFLKQQKIIRASCAYLQKFKGEKPLTRFDVVAIVAGGEKSDIKLIKNAFTAPINRNFGWKSPWQLI